MKNSNALYLLAVSIALLQSSLVFAVPPYPPYEGQQGTRVDGQHPQVDWAHNPHAAVPWSFETDGVKMDRALKFWNGQLVGHPVGMHLSGWIVLYHRGPSVPATFEITSDAPHANVYDGNSYGPHEYGVKVSLQVPRPVGPINVRNIDLCGGGAALVLPGTWHNGKFTSSREEFSFACAPSRSKESSVPAILKTPGSLAAVPTTGGGAAAKCVDWGYKPWLEGGGPDMVPSHIPYPQTYAHKSLPNNVSTAIALHQTCVLMATADYCGDGGVNTVDNTWIDMLNVFSINPVVRVGTSTLTDPLPGPPSTLPFVFETAWTPNGAHCLSRKRWSTLPLDAVRSCADKLIDPRSSTKQGTLHASVCDGESEVQMEDSGVLLFNYSRIMDVGLYQCVDASYRPIVTTTDVTLPFETNAPTTSALASGAACYYLGAMFTNADAANQLVGSTGLVPIYLHHNSSGYITDGTLETGATLEGYIFRELSSALTSPDVQPFVDAELYLESASTTSSTSTSVPGGGTVTILGRLVKIPRSN